MAALKFTFLTPKQAREIIKQAWVDRSEDQQCPDVSIIEGVAAMFNVTSADLDVEASAIYVASPMFRMLDDLELVRVARAIHERRL